MIASLLKRIPHTTITIGGVPYLTRYYLFWKDRSWGNLYLHHFHSSDQGINLHNHPWRWGLSLVLKGGYVEERSRKPKVGDVKIEKRRVGPGTFNVIRSSDFHRVDLVDEKRGAWSLFLAGKRTKDWGFLDRNTGEFQHFSKNPEAIP